MSFNQLTPTRARELAASAGFVRTNSIDSSPHRGSARLLEVINDETLLIQPWHHKKPEQIPIKGVTEHKSKTEKFAMLKQQRDSTSPPITVETVEYVVCEMSKRLYWAGPSGKNRGWTKTLDKAKRFENQLAANHSAGRLRVLPEWRSAIGDGSAVESLPLHQAKQWHEKITAPLFPTPTTNGHAEKKDATTSPLNGAVTNHVSVPVPSIAEQLPQPVRDQIFPPVLSERDRINRIAQLKKDMDAAADMFHDARKKFYNEIAELAKSAEAVAATVQ